MAVPATPPAAAEAWSWAGPLPYRTSRPPPEHSHEQYGRVLTGGSAMPVTDIHAVIPVKNLGNAKQRLAAVLDQPARTALFRAMLEDVLEALSGVTSLAGIVLVTRDAEAIALAERYGAECLIEPANRGHTAAVEFAARALTGRGAGALLQVPGDIPRVTAEEIEAVIAAHAPAPRPHHRAIARSPRLERGAVLAAGRVPVPVRRGQLLPPSCVRARHRGRAGRRRTGGARPRYRHPGRSGGVSRIAVGHADVSPPHRLHAARRVLSKRDERFADRRLTPRGRLPGNGMSRGDSISASGLPRLDRKTGVAPFQWTVKGLGFMRLPGRSSRRPSGIADRGPGDDDAGDTIPR